MKIIVLLSASFLGFGAAMQNVVDQQQSTARVATVVSDRIEAPVMDVLLDTVEISVEAPVQYSKSDKASEMGVLLDTVEIVAEAPRAIAVNAR